MFDRVRGQRDREGNRREEERGRDGRLPRPPRAVKEDAVVWSKRISRNKREVIDFWKIVLFE